MKRIFKILLASITLFAYTSNVFASTVTWKQITDKYKELYDSVDSNEANITVTDNEMIITDENENMSVKFKYEGNTISLVQRDKSSMNDEELIKYSLADYFTVVYLLEIIAKLYDVDLSQVDIDEDNTEEYGIIFKATEIHYEDDVSSVTTEYIDEFSIDLDAFEEATRDLQGTYNEEGNSSITPRDEETVALSLSEAHTNSLDLDVVVTGLGDNETTTCNIYLIPDEDTVYQTGESKIIGTIDNCKNGSNKYTVKNLEANSKYTFQVELSSGDSAQNFIYTLGNEYVTMKTTEAEQATNAVGINKNQNVTTNPKTGSMPVTIAVLAVITIIGYFISSYIATAKRNNEV